MRQRSSKFGRYGRKKQREKASLGPTNASSQIANISAQTANLRGRSPLHWFHAIIYSDPIHILAPLKVRVGARQVVVASRHQERNGRRDVVQPKQHKADDGQEENVQQCQLRPRQHEKGEVVVVHVPRLGEWRSGVMVLCGLHGIAHCTGKSDDFWFWNI